MNDIHQNTASKKGFAWALAAQMLNLGLWLILLPIILNILSKPAIGIWLVFASMAGFAQLLELGFQNALARNFTYVYAGAQVLLRSGFAQDGGSLNLQLLHNLVTAARRIYLLVAILAALALGAGGTVYLLSVIPNDLDASTVLWAWAAFAASYVVNLYFGYLNALLQGRGDLELVNRVTVAAKVAQLILSVGLVLSGFGLLGLGLAALLSTIVSRILAYRYAFAVSRTELHHIRPDRSVTQLIGIMWHNASRYGVVLLGAFLISRANVLIAASQIGVVESASYSLAIQLFLIMQAIAQLPSNLLMPQLSHYQALGDKGQVYRIFALGLAASITIFLVAAVPLVALGNPLLRFLGSSTYLPPVVLLLPITVAFFLELVHGVCGNFIVTRNEVPFGHAALITGIFIAVIGWFITPYLGVAGLIGTGLLCQLMYNNWKWPMVAASHLHDRFLNILAFGFRELWRRLKQVARRRPDASSEYV